MTEYRGKCKCGKDLYVFKMDWWSALTIGIAIGLYFGIIYGKMKQTEALKQEAPNCYSEIYKSDRKDDKKWYMSLPTNVKTLLVLDPQ